MVGLQVYIAGGGEKERSKGGGEGCPTTYARLSFHAGQVPYRKRNLNFQLRQTLMDHKACSIVLRAWGAIY